MAHGCDGISLGTLSRSLSLSAYVYMSERMHVCTYVRMYSAGRRSSSGSGGSGSRRRSRSGSSPSATSPGSSRAASSEPRTPPTVANAHTAQHAHTTRVEAAACTGREPWAARAAHRRLLHVNSPTASLSVSFTSRVLQARRHNARARAHTLWQLVLSRWPHLPPPPGRDHGPLLRQPRRPHRWPRRRLGCKNELVYAHART